MPDVLAFGTRPPRVGKIPVLGDVYDFVTGDDFFTILGTALTAGSYGYAVGILGAAENVALQEGMKGLAGMAASAAQGKPKDFAAAWAGQAAYRAKATVIAGGNAALAPYLASLNVALGPEAASLAAGAWQNYKDDVHAEGGTVESYEAVRRDYLAELKSRYPGTRADVLALGANMANGETIFDTTDWDPRTGEPSALFVSISPMQALDSYYAVVVAEGTPNSPRSERALALYHAAVRAGDEREVRAAAAEAARADLQRRCEAGDQNACSLHTSFTKIKSLRKARGDADKFFPIGSAAGAALGPAAAPLVSLWPLNEALLGLALYTSPIWGGYLAYRWYAKRHHRHR